jgi:hypothetical protein
MEYLDITNDLPTTQGQLPEALIAEMLDHLVSLVDNGKQSATYNHMEMALATTDRNHYAGQFTPLSELAQLTKRWRHWKPRSGNHTPATTQRVMELTLRDRWLERLLAPFILKSDKIRHMVSISGTTQAQGLKAPEQNLLREYKHLMGTARYRTLRIHCLNLEYMIKSGLPIPWQEQDLRQLLNFLLDDEATPSKVNRLWYTLSWISRNLASWKEMGWLGWLRRRGSSSNSYPQRSQNRKRRQSSLPLQ